MQEVVPGVEQEIAGELLQFTEFPLVVLLVLATNDVGVVPNREILNPWQYPPGEGFVGLPTAGIGP